MTYLNFEVFMKRMLIINNNRNLTRKDLSTSERIKWENLFSEVDDLSWGGYMIAENLGKMGINFIIGEKSFDKIKDFIYNNQIENNLDENYLIRIYDNGQTKFGGQSEIIDSEYHLITN